MDIYFIIMKRERPDNTHTLSYYVNLMDRTIGRIYSIKFFDNL